MTAPPDSHRYQGLAASELPQAALEVLATPDLAFALVALGLLGVVHCLAAPMAHIWSVLAGALPLVAGIAGLAALPATTGATLLLILAAASLCMEAVAHPGFGLHAAGGAVSLILAGLFLHGEIGSGAHPAIVTAVSLTTATITFHIARRPHDTRSDPLAHTPVLTGRHTVVLHTDGTHGHAVLGGEVWTVIARHHLRDGQTVRVTSVSDTHLTVEPLPTPPSPAPPQQPPESPS